MVRPACMPFVRPDTRGTTMCRLLARPSLVAVVLFMSSAGGQPPAATFTHPDDLAVGPLEAMLQYKLGNAPAEAKKVRLLFLGKDLIAFREYRYDAEAKKYAAEPDEQIHSFRSDGASPILEVRVGATLWVQKVVTVPGGGVARQFAYREGAVPAPKELRFTPDPGNKASRRAHLVFLLETRLFELESTARRQDKLGYAEATKAAANLKALAAGDRREYTEAFDTKTATERLFANRTALQELKQKLRKLEADTDRKQALNQAVAAAQKFEQGLLALPGAYSALYGESAAERAAGLADASPRAANIFKIDRDRILVGEDIRLAAELDAQELTKGMKALESDFERILDERWAALRKCFSGALELKEDQFRPLRDICRGVNTAAGRKSAVAALNDRWRNAGKLGYCDVMGMTLWAEYATAEALALDVKGAAREKQAADLFANVADMLAVAALLPNDPGTGTWRAEALLAAAKVARDAVAHHRYPKSWSEAFDVRADFGVRIADAALTACDGKGDAAARVRGVRAALLLQRGLKVAALEAVELARTALEHDFDGRYTLARIHGANGSSTLCRNHFLAAADLGRVPLDRLYGDDDFDPIHGRRSGAAKNGLWSEYEHPALQVRYTVIPTEPKAGRLSFEIENTGSLPLVNAKLFIDTRRDPAKDRLGTFEIAYLPPKGKAYWASEILPAGLGRTHRVYVAFTNGRQTYKNGKEKEGVFPLVNQNIDLQYYLGSGPRRR